MSTSSSHPMTNLHDLGMLARAGEVLQTWRDRRRARRELARFTDRDLHDVGLSWTDIAYEIDKPFWRA